MSSSSLSSDAITFTSDPLQRTNTSTSLYIRYNFNYKSDILNKPILKKYYLIKIESKAVHVHVHCVMIKCVLTNKMAIKSVLSLFNLSMFLITSWFDMATYQNSQTLASTCFKTLFKLYDILYDLRSSGMYKHNEN